MWALDRHVLHLDVTDFAVAVERIVDPALRDRPVVVAPPAVRALVLSLSVEASGEGIRPGMPVQEARRRCRGVVVLPPNEPLYARAARAVLNVAEEFSPIVEPAAHGRAYLDLTGTGRLLGVPVDAAARLRRELFSRIRLDAAVGVAVNKLVSRVAADVTEPSGLLDVKAGDEAPFLAPLRVSRLPGVGGEVARELAALNVRIVGQIAALSVDHLVLTLGRFGGVLHQRALGIDPSPVRPPVREPESRAGTTLAEDTNDPANLRAALRGLLEEVGRDLRRRGVCASRLDIEVRYADARTEAGTCRLAVPSDLDPELWRAADALFGRTLGRRVRVRGLLLRVYGLVRPSRQHGLFDDAALRRETALITALDRIRARHGAAAIRFGMQVGQAAGTAA